MAGRSFHKSRFNSQHYKKVGRFICNREKRLIESNYDFINCRLKNNELISSGFSKPTIHSIEYKFVIKYDGLTSPKVFATDPEIEYNDEIHMFPKDNSLCLYHSKADNLVWDYKKHSLFNTIIPWTIEWFIYYELYNITGKWEHPHIQHRLQNIKEIDVNL